MSSSEFKPMANSSSATVDSQSDWENSSYRPDGFPTGVLPRARLNKALRQATMVSAAVTTAVASTLAIDLADDGNLAALVEKIQNAIPFRDVLLAAGGADLMGFDEDYDYSDGTIGAAVQEALNSTVNLGPSLANNTDADKGTGMVGHDNRVNYVKGTAGYRDRAILHLKGFKDYVEGAGVDASAFLQSALNFTQFTTGGHGGIIDMRGCLLELASQVVIPQWTLLWGDAWLPDPSNGAQQLAGACIRIVHGAGVANRPGMILKHSSGVDGVNFWYPNQVPKTSANPVVYGPTLGTDPGDPDSVHDNIHIKNCTFYNSYWAINLYRAGRFHIDNIQGNPLYRGIVADQGLDTCYVSNVHWWNFYAQSDGLLNDFVRANLTAFEIFRVDNLFMSNCFAWDCNTAFYFRDQAWVIAVNCTSDKANNCVVIETAARIQMTNCIFIANASVRPCVWGRDVGVGAWFVNCQFTDAGCVGAQIDGGAEYTFTGCRFDNRHACVVNRNNTTVVKISDTCTWRVAPLGDYNTWVDGERLPLRSVTIPITLTTGGAMTTMTGGYRAPLNTTTDSLLDFELTYIGQRCGLHILEFDLNNVGDSPLHYFQFRVSVDTGAAPQFLMSPLAPLKLNNGGVTKVRIPFHLNHTRFKTIGRLQIHPTAAVTGASLEITNITLYDQASRYITDSQVDMMMRREYNLDPYGMGKTLYAKGKARKIITNPEAGIGRPGATPTFGNWDVGDEVVLDIPVSGGSEGVVCTTAGVAATVSPTAVFRSKAPLLTT